MTNMPKMSARAAKALEVLADGGRFVNRLERNSYTGREQFHRRLITRPGAWDTVVRGIGHAAFYELQALGLLEYCHNERTSVSEPYRLRVEA